MLILRLSSLEIRIERRTGSSVEMTGEMGTFREEVFEDYASDRLSIASKCETT
jgi:hypothetical protein